MSEVLTPVIYQLGIGGIGGFFIGYLIRKVFKIAIFLVFAVFSLIFLAYSNIINVNLDEFSGAVSRFIDTFNPALGSLAPFAAYMPFVGSFIVGLAVGLKMG